MNSPGHRKNILSVDPTEIGVAYEAGPGSARALTSRASTTGLKCLVDP